MSVNLTVPSPNGTHLNTPGFVSLTWIATVSLIPSSIHSQHPLKTASDFPYLDKF